MIYCIDETQDEPIMLINTHIGFDAEDGQGVDGGQFQRELLYLDSLGKKRIQVWINSVGGSVLDGYNIASSILKTKTPVDTYNVGLCASIAGVIFMCGRNRVMMDFAQFMMHPVSGAMDEKSTKSFEDSLAALLAAKADITQDQVAELMADTTWLNAEQCKDSGFATDIEEAKGVNKKRLTVKDPLNFIKEANLITNKVLNINNTIKKKITMLKVTNKLGLTEDANEESILSAIQAIENKFGSEKEDLKNKIEDAENALNAMKETFDAMQDENCKNMVNAFVANGKIVSDEAVVNRWVALAKNDLEGTKEILESLPVNKVANKIEEPKNHVEPKVGDYMAARLKEINNKNK